MYIWTYLLNRDFVYVSIPKICFTFLGDLSVSSILLFSADYFRGIH